MALQKNKYVLGINGLGILPSACLLRNGEIVAIVEEERFTRQKGSAGIMPGKSIKFCLESANIQLRDIDKIMFAWDCNYYPLGMLLFLAKSVFKNKTNAKFARGLILARREILKYQPRRVRALLAQMFEEQGIEGQLPEIKFVSHHLSHAASAFYGSGFRSSYILVIDGSGENQSTSIWYGDSSGIEKRRDVKIPNSLGWFYQAITEFLGFTPNNHEGKTMALAAYGKFNQELNIKFDQIITSDGKGNYTFNEIFAFGGTQGNAQVYSEELVGLLGQARGPGEPLTACHKDIAFATQAILEKIIEEIVKDICMKTDFNGNLCMAGGVSLNCKMNGRIEQLSAIKNLYIPPFSGDNGTAFGAAQVEMPLMKKIDHAYWGPEFNEAAIEKVLRASSLKFTMEPDISTSVASLLVQNKIVAWFQGRMEVGARALGARSILANPCDPKLRDHINEKVKGRELWRPFAASIIEEKKFEFIQDESNSSFMTKAYEIKREMAEKIPGVVHIDNTSRLQIVTKEVNEKYHRLIEKLGEETGFYAVLNTSFNLNEEPIVCSPEQAIKAFLNSRMDYLAIDRFLVTKNI